MSFLSYNFTPEEVLILSDGITVDRTGRPHHFASKAVPVPHLGVVIAGAGVHGVLGEWVRMATFEALARDVDDLALLAPIVLRRLAELGDDRPDRYGGHTVVHHFGWSPKARSYVCDTFDRANGFQHERSTTGHFRVRPNPRSGEAAMPTMLPEWVEFAKRLKAEWDAAPDAERIELGGNLTLIAMINQQIVVRPAYARFDDADEMFERMRAAWVPTTT